MRNTLAQFVALEEENRRRRDECIQLRSILAHRSHIYQHKTDDSLSTSIQFNSSEQMLHESEMIQAFEAQKMVNRQLESELTALTEANNNRIFDLNEEIDRLRLENSQYQEIMHTQIRRSDASPEQSVVHDDDEASMEEQQQQNISYLMQEVKTISADYVDVLAENTRMMRAIDELAKTGQTLAKRLRDNGLDDSIETHESTEEAALMVHKKPTSYQGPLSLCDANGSIELMFLLAAVFVSSISCGLSMV